MAYTSFSFPPSTPVFPKAQAVEEYLISYSKNFGLDRHIRLNTSVDNVIYSHSMWKVSISTGETLEFDWVIVSNGHYRKPRYPDTPGLSDWLGRKQASHSAWYRRPHDLGSTVLIVGAGPSGLDISAEMRTCATSVIHSATGATREDIGNLKKRGRVAQFNPDSSVVFDDGSVESGIDHCILATGYEMAFPFLTDEILKAGLPPSLSPLPENVYNSTYHLFPLAKHIFPLQSRFPPESLTFMGLLIRVAPLPAVEAQAQAIISAYRRPLDVKKEADDVLARYDTLRRESEDPWFIAQEWHRFAAHEQFDYRDDLYRFSGGSQVVPTWEKEMYDNKGILRSAWVELEKSGEADAWVRDVGKNGLQEWVDLLKRLLAWAKLQSYE